MSEDNDAAIKALTWELILAVQLQLAAKALEIAHDEYDAVRDNYPPHSGWAGDVLDQKKRFQDIGHDLEAAVAETDKLVPGLPHPGHEFDARIDRIKSILKEWTIQVDARSPGDHKA